MSKKKGTGRRVPIIQDPVTKAQHQVNWEVWKAMERQAELMQQKQAKVQNELLTIEKYACKKYRTGISRNMEVQVKFTEDGNVDEIEPKLELKGELGKLSEGQQKEVKEYLYEFMLCLNQALSEFNVEKRKRATEVIKAVRPEGETAQDQPAA